MKCLHILKSIPDENTKQLIDIINEKEYESKTFLLYDSDPDYDDLIDQIFNHDKIISWW